MHRIRNLVLLALFASSIGAQCSLGVAPTGTSPDKGVMFDVANTSPITVTITGLDQNFSAAGTANLEVYSKSGSWAGSESSPGAWTLAGSATSVVHPSAGAWFPLPITLNIVIPPFTTSALYVTATNATPSLFASTIGVNQLNAALSADINITIQGGIGKAYPFGASTGLPTNGQLWNGLIRYTPSYSAYETNDSASSLTIDGVQGTRCAPAITTVAQGSPVNVAVQSTNIGLGFTIIVSLLPIVPTGQGAIETPNLQVVNVNFADPNLFFIFGDFPPFPGNFTLPVNAPPPSTTSVQLVNVNPAHPDGFSLSQAGQLTTF